MESIEYLIVGGGYAGDTAAATLRKAGAKGRVVILSSEQERPYLIDKLNRSHTMKVWQDEDSS
jgi:thioredoxin reductase